MEYTLTTDNTRAIMKLWGRFDMKGRQEFFAALQQAKSENTKEIMIDLRKVTFIDSVAIGLLMVAHKQCQASSGVLSLCVSEGVVKQTLDFMNIPDIIPVVTSI